MIRRPLPVDEAVGLARASAAQALSLDETLPEAWAVLGRVKMFYQWDWPGAEADLAHAVALSPNSVEAVEAYGWFLAATGRHGETIATLARAHRLDPMRRETLEHLGLAQWIAGDGERAVETLGTAASVDPKARRPHFRRMFVLDELGRHEEAMAERIPWLELFDDAAMAARFGELQQTGQWRTAMVEWIAGLNQWFERAIQSMAIGDTAATLGWLERCVAERATGAPFIFQYPSFRLCRLSLAFRLSPTGSGARPERSAGHRTPTTDSATP